MKQCWPSRKMRRPSLSPAFLTKLGACGRILPQGCIEGAAPFISTEGLILFASLWGIGADRRLATWSIPVADWQLRYRCELCTCTEFLCMHGQVYPAYHRHDRPMRVIVTTKRTKNLKTGPHGVWSSDVIFRPHTTSNPNKPEGTRSRSPCTSTF